ncbi:protein STRICTOSIDINE SYNTHASE-LIKE 7-like [Magnolia sinica]|uniref:protein STRICTOSIDINE SYNTHASE-LIKE 7-like n=1 Tax=Magnolia sinica TaxID=86752 RepID=UPI002657E9D8|nr:protein STRICTOSIDINE SYNTHASE-LIKE 7-like [Magnolia sinica]
MPTAKASAIRQTSSSLWAALIVIVVGPTVVAVLLHAADELDPVQLPDQHSWFSSLAVLSRNNHILKGSERLGDGLLPGPEDLAFDAEADVLYTGCGDGWIKRVMVAEAAETMSIENWVHVGGRPLGIALGADKQLIVADAYKGLLRVTIDGEVNVLTDEAEGVKFGLTNCVDVTSNGVIYFTDTSYKYNFNEFRRDALEGRPHGRLMSYDPSINQAQVLVRNLYFANGVALSPQQDFLVFCETTMRRCRKYNIQGEKKGLVEDFVDNLPGFPDNIHYCDGHFWIALVSGRTFSLHVFMKYPFVRKALAVLEKFVKLPKMEGHGGVLCASLEGQALALYSDPALYSVTSAIKVGTHLYYGSLTKGHISRLDLTQHPARTM